MSDRRRLRSNGRVAHISLDGQVEAERFTDGETARVTASFVALSSDARLMDRERQLVFGQGFRVLEYDEENYSFPVAYGFCEHDGYVGYVSGWELALDTTPSTHKVRVALTCLKSKPELKSPLEDLHLPLGSEVHVVDTNEQWSEISYGGGDLKLTGFLPSVHLAPIDRTEADPVAVAERFIGTPYIWGGNSSLGIDCSGLIQAGCLACGIACPGDSDQQQSELGTDLPEDESLKRGDLLFWKGHVAWVVDPDTLLHANIYHMAVAYEPLQDAIKRIEAQGDGPVTARKRLGG